MPRRRGLRPTTLLLFLSLAASLTLMAVGSSRGGFLDTTDNPGNSFTAAESFLISQVQTATEKGSTGSVTATYGAAPTEDNLLVLVHHYRDIGTVTLPAGWTEAVALVDSGSTITIAYKIAGAAEGTDVTVSVSVADHQTITIFEYSGIDTVSPLDRTASNACPTAGTSCSTGTTATTVRADELVVAGIGLNGTSGGWANTWTNGFTQQSTVESTGGPGTGRSASSTADRILSATGTFETTESWTTSRSAQGAIATFKIAGGPSAALTGTLVPSALEADIVTGGDTLVITLTNDTWDPTVGADNAITTALINGIDSDLGEATGWDAVVKAGLTFNEVTRTSATVVTITLPAFGSYDVTADETITVTVPASAVASAGAITAPPTFDVLAASAARTGTLVPSALEADIVTGGDTLIITLTNDTWDSTVGADNAITTALINGIDSDLGEATGWDAVVKAGLTFNEVTRTSATVVTITLPAFGSYDITADETITVIVPATAVASAGAITATPTFNVVVASAPPIAQVQKATAVSAGNASSITATYGAAPTQDNLLVLVHHYRTTGTVTLPAGWTTAVVRSEASIITIAYKIAGAAEGTGVTVDVGFADDQTLTIFEYSGIDTASPLDQTASNACNPATTSCSTGTTATTSVADELVIAGLGLQGSSGGWANTWTNGFTQQSTVESTGGGAAGHSASSTADRIVSATGTFETTEGWITSRIAAGVIATFKALP